MRVRTRIIVAVVVFTFSCDQRGSPAGSYDASAPGAGPVSAAVAKPPPAGPPVDFAVVSDIPDCLKVVRKDTTEQGNLLLARVELTTTRELASCVCISRWLLYRSVAERDGLETELASGKVLASQPGRPSTDRLVVLLSERSHPPTDSLVLHVGCAPPP